MAEEDSIAPIDSDEVVTEVKSDFIIWSEIEGKVNEEAIKDEGVDEETIEDTTIGESAGDDTTE